MDFFAQQDLARRNTRLLTLLFLCAVAALIVLTNAMLAGFLWWSDHYNLYAGSRGSFRDFLRYFSSERFGTIGLGISATVGLVATVKWLQLASGGKVVAEAMGGTRILSQTTDSAERRCLNIVDEIALAAGMPVPPVFVLNAERGINAFAAGLAPTDAVIGITRGAITHLQRNELQGVIAHEFSHILNGDMRLNIRLAALLKGITFIGDVGYVLMRASSHHRTGNDRDRSSNGPAVPLLGLGLWILGWLGGLASGFIKAAISRQKEYLADACAVQYTRDNSGIADALKVIGGYVPGSLVHTARADELSHIFFGQIRHRLWQLFATHPPLAARIRRLDPAWDGAYITRKVEHYAHAQPHPAAAEVGVGRAALVAAALAAAEAGAEQDAPTDTTDTTADASFAAQGQGDEFPRHHGLPQAFVRYSHEPLGASALMLALLISPHEQVRAAQYRLLRESGVQGLEELTHTLAPGVAQLAEGQRLPLLELCLPALKSQSTVQYHQFKRLLLALIRADRRTELLEWCLYQLLRHYIDPEFIQLKPSTARYRSLRKVQGHLRVVLSMLAHNSSGDTEHCFRTATAALDCPTLALLPQADCSLAAFSRAVRELADCYPLLKPKILKAMNKAANADGTVSAVERELLASIAAAMDCPLPDALRS
ncbi:M48 family metalloprotease [Haliea sp.]|jgi:Zn-dependent protease with chaperone function|uniref:M48 family metalloprotease n=1 Tax=Haliea TaxID=475794 RepID=UPI000C52C8C6|nr:M48 family metalloprotease [Haliea sp.]MAY94124.1 peptidase M48 [Haliea sp.]MBP71282.1 peptidase M48 [Haliea sp.]HCD55330.1 peptidase M48 [Halieaceae bacterium]|tara:strand:+ start:2231 stop:4195 length:1965 start_codon:yes stop_codon:yes gene_type:complete